MRRIFGLRFLVEAAFIVLVAVLVSFADVSKPGIVAAIAGAWGLVALVEWGLSLRGRELPQAEEPVEVGEPAPAPEPRHVRVVAPEPEPERKPQPEAEREPEREPEPEAEPEPVRQPPPARVAPTVVALPRVTGPPREWNLWDLERVARECAGADEARDEERSFLLMYLREFADPDGVLPVTFDPLVREAFGDVLGPARL